MRLHPISAFFLGLIFTTAVYADDTKCRYGSASVSTNISIEPHEDAFARLIIDNKLASRDTHICEVFLYGVKVVVNYDAGRGAKPDWFHITVPPGFVAEPSSILIEDKYMGEVIIRHVGGFSS